MSVSEVTACFVDHGGLYLALARKLAESYKKVFYFDPCEEAFPTFERSLIGDGFDKLQRIRGLWRYKRETNLFIFPDSQGWDLQKELALQGYLVWGSNRAENLEMDREGFHKTLAEVGLEVPKFEKIVGLSALEDYLRDKTDKWIKISRYRGSIETCHWRSWDDDRGKLCAWRVKFGGVVELIPFLVFDHIDTDLEIGGDTYSVGSGFPNYMLDGTEWKDKAYFGAFKAVSEMPKQTRAVMNAFGPVLGMMGHANFWSMEIRVKGDKFWFNDATPRAPLPGTASQMEIYSNLPEIIHQGAQGKLIDPEPAKKFSAECILSQKGSCKEASSLAVPPELEQWMKLAGCYKVGDRVWWPPDESNVDGDIGWLVAIGDTPSEAIENLKGYAELLPDGVTAKTEALVDIIKEVESAEEQGIQITKAEMPEPAEVIE